MKVVSSQPGRHVLDGSLRVFLAELLLPITGMATAAYLSRRLGPEGYAQFALAAVLVSWIAGNVAAIYSRATVKFIAESSDWRPFGSMILRLHVWTGCGAAAAVWLLAPSLSVLLKEPALAFALSLFAVDIPLWLFARAHQSILIGLGRFHRRAMMSVGRWIGRLLLIVLFVELGWSVTGAVVGTIGATVIEAAIGRWHVRPSWSGHGETAYPGLWDYSIPLFLSGLALSCVDRLDLYVLKALGAATTQVGYFAAAQNVSISAVVLAGACSPLLISTLTGLMRSGRVSHAHEIGVNAMRVVIGLLPVVGLVAGSASGIVSVIYGEAFAASAAPLSVLILSGWAFVMLSVTTAILTAADKPRWTVWVTGPLVPSALVGHLLIIPRWGSLGAAWVTASVACAGALVAVLAVSRVWRGLPSAGTVARSLVVCLVTYAAAALWPASGLDVFLKVLVVGGGIPLVFYALGEFPPSEIAFVRSLIGGPAVPGPASREA
jgi:O-antigen/teichoic acid export membrane protein